MSPTPIATLATFMADHEGYGVPMYTNYTDAENTGAPMVPIATDDSNIRTDGGTNREELEEVVLSHRITE
jgi:hypothetical protein